MPCLMKSSMPASCAGCAAGDAARHSASSAAMHEVDKRSDRIDVISVPPAGDVGARGCSFPPALGHQWDEAVVIGDARDGVDVLVVAAPAVFVFHPVVDPRLR